MGLGETCSQKHITKDYDRVCLAVSSRWGRTVTVWRCGFCLLVGLREEVSLLPGRTSVFLCFRNGLPLGVRVGLFGVRMQIYFVKKPCEIIAVLSQADAYLTESQKFITLEYH